MAHHYLEYYPIDFPWDDDQLSDAMLIAKEDNEKIRNHWLATYKEKEYDEEPSEVYDELIRMAKEALLKQPQYADDFGTEGAGLYGWDYEDSLVIVTENSQLSEISRKDLL